MQAVRIRTLKEGVHSMQEIEPNEIVIDLIHNMLVRWDEVDSPDWPIHPSPFAIQRFAYFHQKEMEKSMLTGSEAGEIESVLNGMSMYDEYRSFVTHANNVIIEGFLGSGKDAVLHRLEVIKASFEALCNMQTKLRALADTQGSHVGVT